MSTSPQSPGGRVLTPNTGERGFHVAQANATAIPLADKSVNLVFTSPPYMDARTYGISAQRGCMDWIEWMLGVVSECVRVSRGLVLVNCAGVTRDWCYRPGPEGLLYEWWKRGGRCWRPAYWRRVGIPGSGGKQWLRADVEYVLAFTGCQARIPWSDNTVNGHPPKAISGTSMTNRLPNGTRRKNSSHGDLKLTPEAVAAGATLMRWPQTKREHSKRLAGGGMEYQVYIPPELSNPGTLVDIGPVGGGMMGHPLAHESEAPFPEALAEWFIKGWCPAGGRVLDPFSGSGTTACVADKLGRVGIGFDLRMSQCELAMKRYATPWAKKTRKAVLSSPEPYGLFGGGE